MSKFTVALGSEYVCLGPLVSVVLASKIESCLSDCWIQKPKTARDGTVLKHSVDNRIKCESGEWDSATLYNTTGCACGGMVWHHTVGDAKDAAMLIKTMEEQGGIVISNNESDKILELGIRFIGRYDWNDHLAIVVSTILFNRNSRVHSYSSCPGSWSGRQSCPDCCRIRALSTPCLMAQ